MTTIAGSLADSAAGATDYPATQPGFTMWTGRWRHMDTFVYGELRGTARPVRAWPT